jgi:hypothetical protein
MADDGDHQADWDAFARSLADATSGAFDSIDFAGLVPLADAMSIIADLDLSGLTTAATIELGALKALEPFDFDRFASALEPLSFIAASELVAQMESSGMVETFERIAATFTAITPVSRQQLGDLGRRTAAQFEPAVRLADERPVRRTASRPQAKKAEMLLAEALGSFTATFGSTWYYLTLNEQQRATFAFVLTLLGVGLVLIQMTNRS